MFEFWRALAVSLGLSVVAGAASSATYNFDFTGGAWTNHSSLKFASDPVSALDVEVRPVRMQSNLILEEDKKALIHGDTTGLGICRAYFAQQRNYKCYDKNPLIDGHRGTDMAVFDFGTDVSLNTISFDRTGVQFTRCISRDCSISRQVINSFQLYGLGSGGWELLLERTPVDLMVNPGENFTYSIFGISAQKPYDSFGITGISVSTDNPYAPPRATLPPPTPFDDLKPYPLPASGLLLIAGLCALVITRRTKRTS